MRHNRKAVMAERYKLYMKKNVFNGRYFIRNIQLGIAIVFVLALIIGVAVIVHSSGSEIITANAEVSVKDALFGVEENEKKIKELNGVINQIIENSTNKKIKSINSNFNKVNIGERTVMVFKAVKKKK